MSPLEPMPERLSTDLPDARPSRKVVASSTSAAVAGFVLWLIAVIPDPDVTPPAPVVGLVLVLVPAACSFVAGYVTRRSARELQLPEIPGPAAAAD